MSAPLDYVWDSALRQLEDLRQSSTAMASELAELKARYEKQVEYSNEIFSESAGRTGNLHRALGFDDEADFESDDVYFEKLKTIIEERRMFLRRLTAAEERIRRIKDAVGFVRPLLACDGPNADHTECSLCVVRDAVFGNAPIALDADEDPPFRPKLGHTDHCAARQQWGDGECECAKNLDALEAARKAYAAVGLPEPTGNRATREGAAISLLRRIVDESHSTEGGALQTFAPSKELLAEASAFVNADDVSAALALVSKYEASR